MAEPGVMRRLLSAMGVQPRSAGVMSMGPGDVPAVHSPQPPRTFEYPIGLNLRSTPQRDSGTSFKQLRQLSDSCDLVRLAIETRKDQMCRMSWDVRRRDNRSSQGAQAQAVRDFLRCPDGENPWSIWLRMLLEEMFVLDAVALLPRVSRAGTPLGVELIDGSTITRKIDYSGRTPEAPNIAYQQVLSGLTTAEFSADQMLYFVRNKRVDKVYGYGPVEQILLTVNIALRRQMHQLEYYTAGNIPEALCGVPGEWTPEQIKEFQEYWDILIEGDSASRRHMRFVPGDIAQGYRPTRESVLKDEYDEWLARVVCYAFSLPPTALIRQMNRATAESSSIAAHEEGVEPTKLYVKGIIDAILSRFLKVPHLEFVFQYESSLDRLKQAQIFSTYLKDGIMSPNEARLEMGLGPRPGGDDFAPSLNGPITEAEPIRSNASDPANSTT